MLEECRYMASRMEKNLRTFIGNERSETSLISSFIFSLLGFVITSIKT